MRKFLLLALLAPVPTLAACELQPGPPRPSPSAQTPPAPTPPAPTPPQPTPAQPTPTPPINAAPGNVKVAIEITPPCLEVAMHVAGVIIASAEPAQRSIFEAERDRIVRSTGEVCTTQRWSEPAMACYKGASTQPQIKACEVKFPMQPVQRQLPRNIDPPGAGGMRPEPGAAGSAAPARPARPAAGSGSGAR